MRIEWNASLSLGNPDIDSDHKELVALTNGLNDAIQHGKGPERIADILAALQSYVARHFAREEAAFANTSYPDGNKHRAAHRRLEDQVQELVTASRNAPETIDPVAVHQFLRTWLVDHIMKTDMDLKRYL